jgi:tryptophan synthase alpha chain
VGEGAFLPFVTAGFPDPATSRKAILTLDREGADVIEVGIPHSDPLADGPVIQQSSSAALREGMTTEGAMELVASLAGEVSSPLVFMTYYNLVLNYGLNDFAQRAGGAGVSGVIIPDLPPEEAGEWKSSADRFGLDTIFMVAPTTPESRMELIDGLTEGFLYYVNICGTTGGPFGDPRELQKRIAGARRRSSVPVAAGFGVSSPKDATLLATAADGVVVGSLLLRRMAEAGREKCLGELAGLARRFRRALSREEVQSMERAPAREVRQ